MKVTRQSIIEARRQGKRQKLNKIWAFTAKASIVLFASVATLSHLSTQELEVSAQTTASSRTEFLNLVGNYAREVARKNDLYASVMVAQAILESGWGQSSLAQAPNYNLFGIKGSYNGNTVKMDTLEDDGSGNYYSTVEPFRKYSNYGESLADYASILTGDNDPSSWRYKFYYGARMSQTNSYHDATKHLTGRYATDTRYGTKLNQLIDTYKLTQYDPPEKNTTPAAPTTESTVTTPKATGQYTVKAGESYWAISHKYGISIAELQRLNGTTSLFLYPGQLLKVPGSQVTPSTSAPSAPISSNSTVSEKVETAKPTVVTTGAYTVNSGDSYWSISRKYGISIAELQRLNGTTSLLIYPGQVLKVPGASETKKEETPIANATTTIEKTEVATPTTVATSGYTVNPGDSYWSISRKYGISIAELQRLNGATSLLIHPGQVLKVPGANVTANTPTVNAQRTPAPTTNSTVNEKKEAEVVSPSVSAGTYTVSAGDSYWKIATKYGISITELQRLNGTTNYNLYPGQTLKVPGGQGGGVTPTPTNHVTPTNVVSATGTHTVQAGESYGLIAAKYGTTVEALQRLNGATSLLIHPGQVLKVTGVASTPVTNNVGHTVAPTSTPTPATPTTQIQAVGEYTVKAGESYGIIAARYGVSVETLQQMNGATSLLIHPGQVLRVPVR